MHGQANFSVVRLHVTRYMYQIPSDEVIGGIPSRSSYPSNRNKDSLEDLVSW